ncbi:MAG: putative exported protein of unknown function [Tardiphaga sp.]|jgi:hypothetical protein|nr:putative exported protein of unknown function [Tardiphaga sp.]
MMPISTSRTAGPGSVVMRQHWRTILLHTIAAATFIFLLQRYALSATLESSLLWAVVFGGCAAVLATSQANRRP